MSALDAAALNPGLQEPGTDRHYFADAARLRSAVTTRLARELAADSFTPYLTQNTTAGLLAVLWAACRVGQEVRLCGPEDQHYPPYAAILPSAGPPTGWDFRTHVSPLTAAVDPLDADGVLVVDAAQSLGTLLTATVLRRGDVVVAPLHKHLGLCAGAGVVLVRRATPALAPVHQVLAVAESGAQSLLLLRQLSDALDAAGDRLFNRAEIVVDDELRAWCAGYGLRPLGSRAGVPFACVTTTDGGPIEERMSLRGWRHLRAVNAARFSRYERGRAGDAPVDHTATFRAAVLAAVREP